MTRLKLIALFVTILFYEVKAGPQCHDLKPNEKFDCDPDQFSSQKACESRGCCWVPNLAFKPYPNQPWCFYPSDFVGYQVDHIENYSLRTVVTLKRKIASGFPRDSQTVTLEITEINESSLR